MANTMLKVGAGAACADDQPAPCTSPGGEGIPGSLLGCSRAGSPGGGAGGGLHLQAEEKQSVQLAVTERGRTGCPANADDYSQVSGEYVRLKMLYQLVRPNNLLDLDPFFW